MLFFAVHYISIALFTHAHALENRIVIHSHPFNPFSEKSSNHDHSEKELFHIGILSHLDILPSFIYPIVNLSCTPDDNESFKEISLYHDLFRSYIFLLRAPPLTL